MEVWKPNHNDSVQNDARHGERVGIWARKAEGQKKMIMYESLINARVFSTILEKAPKIKFYKFLTGKILIQTLKPSGTSCKKKNYWFIENSILGEFYQNVTKMWYTFIELSEK